MTVYYTNRHFVQPSLKVKLRVFWGYKPTAQETIIVVLLILEFGKLCVLVKAGQIE